MFSHRLYWSLQSASTKLFGVLDLYFFSIGYFLPPPLPTSHRWLLFLHLWQEYIFPALSFVLSHVYPRCSWQPLHAFQCVASKTLVTTWCKLIDVSKKGRISPLWTFRCDALLNPTEIITNANKWFVRLFMHTPGDRKNATARVWVKKGSGNVTVNEVPFVKYFPRMEDRYGICIQLFCRLH